MVLLESKANAQCSAGSGGNGLANMKLVKRKYMTLAECMSFSDSKLPKYYGATRKF